jgi:FHS family L-fucose permease-like MFS transporter
VTAHTAVAISMMNYILALVFSIYVNIYKSDSIDLHRNTEVNVTIPVSKEIEMEEETQCKPTTANVETVEEEQQRHE